MMAYKTCPDCGCRIYEYGCVNCNEEDYISMQKTRYIPCRVNKISNRIVEQIFSRPILCVYMGCFLSFTSFAQKKTVNLFKECYKIEAGALVQIGCDTAFRIDKFFVGATTFSYTPTIDTVWKFETSYYFRNRSTGITTRITEPELPDWWAIRNIDTTIYNVGDTLVVNSVNQVASLLAQGKLVWEIAKEMKITSTAVEAEITRLRILYSAKNAMNLVYIMTKKGLL